MMRNRKNVLKSLLLGLLVSVLFTLLCMLLMSAALLVLRFSDSLITTLNQIVKITAVVLGTCAAVPKGGEKGLATGSELALFYSVFGYILYLILGGSSFSVRCMLGEILLCWAAGAVAGAVRANITPRSRSRAKHAC